MSEQPTTEATVEPTTDDRTANEAAKYRRKLREVESEVEILRSRVTSFQRADVERHAADLLAQPSDLFDVGAAELDTFLDAEGNVDRDAVQAASTALTENRPGLARERVREDRSQGLASESRAEASWSALFQKR